jgi:hypothetical protein
MTKYFLWISTISLILFAIVFPSFSAEETNPTDQNLVSVDRLNAGGAIGDIFVIVRKDGHLDGQPYVAELRPSCGNSSGQWKNFEAVDSESACFVVPSTTKLLAGGQKIELKLHKSNAESYNGQTMQGKLSILPECTKNSQTFTFDLKNLCSRK